MPAPATSGALATYIKKKTPAPKPVATEAAGTIANYFRKR